MMRVLLVAAFLAAFVFGNGRAFAQSGSDWVELCEESPSGVICQAWSVTGGDRLEQSYGCTGATGGGLLVCRGRALCEVAEIVTVRGFDGQCETPSSSSSEAASPDEAAAAQPDSSFDPEDFGEPDEALLSEISRALEEAESGSNATEDDRDADGEGEAGTCWVNDPEDTAVNVRATPNGEIINRLRNGREVEIASSRDDDQGRPWRMVEGTYQGERRRWGYVFGKLVSCSDSGETAPAKASAPIAPANGPRCVLHDDEEGGVNVRATPNGKIINRLRNGRVVYATGSGPDDQGRPWLLVESEYDGQWRRWGYVFGEIARCD